MATILAHDTGANYFSKITKIKFTCKDDCGFLLSMDCNALMVDQNIIINKNDLDELQCNLCASKNRRSLNAGKICDRCYVRFEPNERIISCSGACNLSIHINCSRLDSYDKKLIMLNDSADFVCFECENERNCRDYSIGLKEPSKKMPKVDNENLLELNLKTELDQVREEIAQFKNYIDSTLINGLDLMKGTFVELNIIDKVDSMITGRLKPLESLCNQLKLDCDTLNKQFFDLSSEPGNFDLKKPKMAQKEGFVDFLPNNLSQNNVNTNKMVRPYNLSDPNREAVLLNKNKVSSLVHVSSGSAKALHLSGFNKCIKREEMLDFLVNLLQHNNFVCWKLRSRNKLLSSFYIESNDKNDLDLISNAWSEQIKIRPFIGQFKKELIDNDVPLNSRIFRTSTWRDKQASKTELNYKDNSLHNPSDYVFEENHRSVDKVNEYNKEELNVSFSVEKSECDLAEDQIIRSSRPKKMIHVDVSGGEFSGINKTDLCREIVLIENKIRTIESSLSESPLLLLSRNISMNLGRQSVIGETSDHLPVDTSLLDLNDYSFSESFRDCEELIGDQQELYNFKSSTDMDENKKDVDVNKKDVVSTISKSVVSSVCFTDKPSVKQQESMTTSNQVNDNSNTSRPKRTIRVPSKFT